MIDIDYVEGLNLEVKASAGTGDDLDCTLVIANNSFPSLALKNVNSHGGLRLSGLYENAPSLIKCTSKLSTISLYNNKLSGFHFTPEYIVMGETPENIKGVDISLSGLYSFFDGYSNFEFSNTCIKKEISDYLLNTEFYIGDEIYNFSVYHDYSCSRKFDTTTLVEDAIVRVYKSSGDISLDEIKIIIKKIRVSFSLLLGFDLSIRKTWLVDDNELRCSSFYFFSASKPEQPFEHPHECFVYSAQLLTIKNWQNILIGIFNDPTDSSILEFWVRLVSMFSFKGFWEYEILGVVSLLDAYSKKYHKKYTDKKMPVRTFDKLKDEIKAVLIKYKDSLPTNKDQSRHCDVVDNMISQIGYIKNTNAQDFRLILKFLMGKLSENIRNLINFKDEDFEIIIKIRNSAAHGAPIDENIMKNIQRAMIVKEKIKFLMLYLFFKSLNFTDDEFVKLCARTFNKIRLGAQLDSYTLEVVYGNTTALDIDFESFEKAKQNKKSNIGIIYHIKSKIFEHDNKELNEIINCSHEIYSEKHSSVVDLIYDKYLYTGIYSVELCSTLYLCHADEKIKIHSSFLIKMND